ncbi:MAG: HupE/UreJ family protein [Pseudomonadota bacterium]
MLTCADRLYADQFELALLRVIEHSDAIVELTWKRPTNSQQAPLLQLVLPAGLEPLRPAAAEVVGTSLIETRLYRSQSSIRGQLIEIDGLKGSSFEVMLNIELKNGDEFSTVLNGSNDRFEIPDQPDSLILALSYGRTGLIHISEGADHLLFLLALTLLIASFGQLVAAVTAFTVAHSLTLALATFEIIKLPAPPIEALIALSIVFLAAELVRANSGQVHKTRMAPWQMAGFFGLLHGLGFAGALADIGLPSSQIPLALLMFNLGVEIGQLVFVAIVFAGLSLLAYVHRTASQFLRSTAPFAIGGIAAAWTIQRVAQFV